MSANTTEKCTPFCPPFAKDCKHHDLLVALLNIDGGLPPKEGEHDHLEKMIKKHEASGWDKNSAILEKNEEFRFPLLHWACVLAKPRTVQWLLDNGFNPTVQSSDTKETALHRTIVTISGLATSQSNRQSLFESILPLLRDCLKIGDHRQETPIHLAAREIRNKEFSSLYENIFNALVAEIQKMPEEEQSQVLNSVDIAGDTVLHILADSNRLVYTLQNIVDAGADPLLINNLAQSPLDIARKHAAVDNVKFFEQAWLQGGRKRKSLHCGANTPNEDANKKRRSERSSAVASLKINNPDFVEKHFKATGSLLDEVPLLQRKTSKLPEPLDLDAIQNSNSSDGDSIKEEDQEEYCQCCEEDKTVTSEKEEEEPNNELSDEANGDLPLLEMIQEAGIFSNLNSLIKSAKAGHSTKLAIVEKKLKETDIELEKCRQEQRHVQQEIIRLRNELKLKASALGSLSIEKDRIDLKRSLLEKESMHLKKKMQCCERLIKNVSKNVNS